MTTCASECGKQNFKLQIKLDKRIPNAPQLIKIHSYYTFIEVILSVSILEKIHRKRGYTLILMNIKAVEKKYIWKNKKELWASNMFPLLNEHQYRQFTSPCHSYLTLQSYEIHEQKKINLPIKEAKWNFRWSACSFNFY